MTDQTNIAIAGALGFMGRELIKLISAADDLKLVGGVDRPDSSDIGQDLGPLIGLKPQGALLRASAFEAAQGADVLIDFSIGKAAAQAATALAGKRVSLVIGATGFEPAHEAAILEAAKTTAILKSGNMSLGVNLLAALTRQAAARLGEDWDIEIFEAHHRRKVDAPSGTALLLGRAAAEGRKVDLNDKKVAARDGQTGARKPGDIGFAVVRGGGIVGDHDVSFITDEESITLSHHASNRAIFAKGALAAARWVKGKPAGLYSMADVLGL